MEILIRDTVERPPRRDDLFEYQMVEHTNLKLVGLEQVMIAPLPLTGESWDCPFELELWALALSFLALEQRSNVPHPTQREAGAERQGTSAGL